MEKKRVLLIDDDEDLRLALRLTLQAAGYAVFEAEGVTTAWDAMLEARPHLILLDVMMETSTAGFQFVLELRNCDPLSPYGALSSLPVLMLTAIHQKTPFRFEPDQNYLPVQAFLEKPVDPETLLTKVRQLVGSP